MKELQNFLYKHMDALKHHKRYVAMLTALSLLVSFMVPLILIEPADSMTKQKLMLLSDTSNMAMVSNLNDGQDGNNGYSKGQLSEVTLLIGDGVEWAQGCLDADDVIEAAKREYFIGIASDFCVFLEGDLKPKGADAEGRVAVGGNIIFTGQYNYQIGNGDYTTGTPLKETDNYTGITNYAHVITDGYVINLNTLSQGKKGDNNYYYPLEGDFYKRFVIDGNIDDCKHYTWPNGSAQQVPYSTGCQHDNYNPNELAQFYQADLIDFEAVFEWLKTQSQKLSNKTATGTSQVQDGVATFTGPGQDSDAVTIYFDLEQWASDIREVRFIDVPENANLVVNCGGNIVKIGSEYGAVNFSTSINGEVISIIDSSGTEVNANNRKESEQILYNFYECGTDLSNLPTTDHGDEIVPYSLFVNTNFNGTILAPYAIVASDKECRGHLSGSLIAQKFTGGLEFGYRPYRGGTDILGSTAGYVVPFDKFVDDLNGNGNDNPRLAGATFEIKDENNNVVDTWTSTEETSYITFPTELDFTGGTIYTADNDDVTHTYTISEKSAPEGYITTDKKYKIVITETVDLNYLLLVDNGTIPTRVTVNLELFEGDASIGTRTLKIRDGYDENQHVQRIIEVQNGEDKDYFILTIENGNITNIEKVNDSSSFESLLQQADAENISFNAVTYSGADIQADEAITEEPITVDPYPYAYTPENLLTDYNAFAFNELYHKNDVIGAMAAKNLMTGDSMGKAAKADSYFENLGVSEPKDQYGNSLGQSTLNYELDFMFKGDNSVDAGGNYKIYYQEKGDYVSVSDDDLDNLILISNNYIDFVKAKQDVLNWSTSKKYNEESGEIPEGSKLLSTDDIITIDGAQGIKIEIDNEHNNYIIPESLLSNVTGNYNPNQKIKICFTKSNDAPITAEELKTSGVVVTFQGDIKSNNGNESDPVHIIEFSSIKFKDSDGQYKQLANAFDNTDGKVNGDTQANLYGTKLLFNFPDLKWDDTNNVKLQVHDLAGHIVAPNAYVLYVGGDGGVIAENVWVGAEIHYYPYYVNTNRTGDDVPEIENREEVNNGDSTGGTTGGGTNDDETIVPQFPPITDYSAIVTEITITDKKTPQKLTNSNYYYDPTSLMIMPLPDETPSFINEYALVFKKQSDESTALAGATIELQSGTISNGKFNSSTTHGADSTPPWEWGNETNTYSIPLKKIQVKDLDTNVVYRFFEQTPPEGYEIAKPIYFVKTDNTTIRYTDDETKLSDINSWTEIEFSESNKSSNIITMTDYKIYGPEIKLSKVQIGSSNPLQGAEFVLCAVDGDTLVYPLNDGTKLTSGSDGMIDFTKVFKANPDNCNSEYIKNGYLVPGEYYLKETKAPDKYEVPTDNMYFVVNEDYTVEAEKVEEPDYVVVFSGTKTNDKYEDSNSYNNVTAIEVIFTSTNGETDLLHRNNGNDNGNLNIQGNENWIQGMSAWTSLFRNNSLGSYKLTHLGENNYEVIYNFNSPVSIDGTKNVQYMSSDSSVTIKEVRIYSNSSNSSTGSSGSSSGDVASYTIDNIVWGNNNSVTVEKLTFYYEGKDPFSRENINVTTANEYWHSFGLGDFDKNNVIGIEIKVGGSGTGMLKVQASGDVWIWGAESDQWNPSYTTVSAGQTYILGVTELPTDDNEELPDDSNGSGESNENQNGNSTLISVKDGTTDTLLVGNNKAGATTNISVEKMWNDSENLYNIRPDSITVQLKQDNSNFGEPVTLNAANGWKHTWTGIPRLKDNSETETYKYSVVEISAPTGYTVSYGNNDGIDSGQITITNTLKTTNIPVEKKWKNSDGSPATPNVNTITVKLQKHNGSGYSDFLDKDGNPVTLVLSSDNNWLGEFTGIPEGQYQVVESVVPSGWTESSMTENGKTIITNTQKAGALKLTKIWQNDTADQRPQNITIKIYRTTIPPTNNNNNGSGGGTTGGGNNVDAIPPENSKYETVTEDYARLLQYSLYFYDANMCGDEVTENSVYSWRNDCHTYDGEYAGGFHDAGDHAMFGLPQGFTASTLGWTYNEYKTTFDSLGLTNHYQLIMKEFCDFFVKSTKMSNGSVSDLLLDKGDAGTDHSYWGSPEAQTQGERGGLVWANSSNSGGNIAAEYAAALASYYLNFPNDSNSSTYLEYAKALYDYSNVKNSPRSIGGIYEDNSITDEQAWAAAWLYLATNEETYKNDCKNKLNSLSIPARGHFWGDPTLGAAIIYATRIEPDETTIENKISTYLNSTCSGDSFKVLDSWGSARHNTLLQLTAITYDKYQSTKSYSDWCKNQMAFILGDNSINVNGKTGVCFVTGFKDGDSDESNDAYLPQHPHHRAASGYDGWDKFNDAKANGTSTQYKYAHTLIGALAGGPRGGNSYTDNIDDTVCNEVAIDYNAGLVGAAAALYSVYEKGNTVNADVMKADGLEIKDGKTIYEEQSQAASVNIEDIMNTSAMSFKRNAVSVLADGSRYTIIDTLPVNEALTGQGDYILKSDLNYSNVNLIEVEFEHTYNDANNNWFAGYVSCDSVSEWNKQYSLSSNNLVFSVDLSSATNIKFVKVYDNGRGNSNDTVKVKEIRFYKEKTGPTVTITNAPTTALKIGATHQLSATGTENTINWTSSDNTVAEVDSTGNVTIKAMPQNSNKVTITATDSTDSTVTASVEIEIEAMTLTPKSSDVVIGDKVVYNANYDGFTINSGTGYSVNKKEVTATNTGNYTVSATYAGSSATASLNVSALQINGQTPLDVNGTYQFSVNGQTDGHTFEWKVIEGDSDVLEIDTNGNITTHKSGSVKIQVTKDDTYTAEYDVTVQKGALSISVNPTQIRAGGTAELSAMNADGDVRYTEDSEYITIDDNGLVTAENVESQETVEITGTLGQESATCNLTIIPLPSISAPDSKNRIGIGETLQLTASNILGTATWRLEDEDTSILTVDENGLVTGVSTGTKTIIVEDTDGTIGTYEITVAELAADPGLPDEPEFYTTVTLTSADLANGNWEKIVNLPIEDENGQKYYYYIEEVTVNDVVNGNGGKYMPIKYEGQGVTLNEVGSETPEISVTNRLTQTIQGQLPSTGGSGVKTYYYFGGALMLLGIAGFTGLKRRERKRREE